MDSSAVAFPSDSPAASAPAAALVPTNLSGATADATAFCTACKGPSAPSRAYTVTMTRETTSNKTRSTLRRGVASLFWKLRAMNGCAAYFDRMSVCLSAVGVSSTLRQPVTTLVSAVSLTHTGISSLSVR